MTGSTTASAEICAGERFEFGRNWANFAESIDKSRVRDAMKSLQVMLERDRLDGVTFLDVGCGSGLFSLAARELGAVVTSFDFDPESVRTTERLRNAFGASDDAGWRILSGSVLDTVFLSSLGSFGVVYSWGVLHHTGAMWQACEHVAALVAPSGTMFISIYNDQGLQSRIWRRVKRAYVSSGPLRRRAIIGFAAIRLYLPGVVLEAVRGIINGSQAGLRRDRGMSRRHDLVDWVGGYPFEVASPEEIFGFYRARGFLLERMQTCGGGLGCNQFVFRRV